MKLLVAGAGGMLGRAVTRQAHDRSVTVTPLAHAALDITDATAVADAVRRASPDVIINCAAYTAVDACETNVALAESVNATGPRNLAVAAQSAGALLVHISTDYVFDGRATRPYTESDTPAPLSAYGWSKLHGEQAVESTGARRLIVRSLALYGAGGKNFVDTMADKALAGDTVSVVTDQTTTPTHVEDLARGIFALLDKGLEGLYHVASEGQCTWRRCAQVVYETLGADPGKVQPTTSEALGRPARRPAYSVLSTKRFTAVTGTTLPPWDDSVRKYLMSTRGNRNAGGARA